MRRVYTAPELNNDLTTVIRVDRWRHRRPGLLRTLNQAWHNRRTARFGNYPEGMHCDTNS